jgi:hypothetical protein
MTRTGASTLPLRGIAVWLFLCLNFLFLLTSSGRVRTIDEVTVEFEVESIVTRASTSVPQALDAKLFYGKYDRTGKPQPPYGFGQAMLDVPWFVAGRVLGAWLPGVPAASKNVFLDAVLTASSATFAALSATLMFLIFARLGLSIESSLFATLLFALATPNFTYSSYFFSEPQASALLLTAALVLFSSRTDEANTAKQGLLAGGLLGIALWVRPTHVIAFPVFLLAMFVQRRKQAWRGLLAFASVVGVFGLAYLLRNQILFGSPFDFGYPEFEEGGKQLNSFHTPLLTGLFGFLFSPAKSVFLFAPPILLAIPGLRKLWQRRRALAIVAGVTPVVYLLFFAHYTQWEGGFCVGPRYLVPAIALLCLGLGPILETGSRRTQRAAWALLFAGLFVQLTGMATSFLEDQANGSYYDAGWNLRMTDTPLLSQTRLWMHYAAAPVAAPIGRGFDRWFVFLGKTGISKGTILAGILFELLGLMFCVYQLRKALRNKLNRDASSSEVLPDSQARA